MPRTLGDFLVNQGGRLFGRPSPGQRFRRSNEQLSGLLAELGADPRILELAQAQPNKRSQNALLQKLAGKALGVGPESRQLSEQEILAAGGEDARRLLEAQIKLKQAGQTPRSRNQYEIFSEGGPGAENLAQYQIDVAQGSLAPQQLTDASAAATLSDDEFKKYTERRSLLSDAINPQDQGAFDVNAFMNDPNTTPEQFNRFLKRSRDLYASRRAPEAAPEVPKTPAEIGLEKTYTDAVEAVNSGGLDQFTRVAGLAAQQLGDDAALKRVHGLVGRRGVFSIGAGKNIRDFNARLDTLKSVQTLLGLPQIKGAISEKELELVGQAGTILSRRSISEDAAIGAYKDIENFSLSSMERLLSNARAGGHTFTKDQEKLWDVLQSKDVRSRISEWRSISPSTPTPPPTPTQTGGYWSGGSRNAPPPAGQSAPNSGDSVLSILQQQYPGAKITELP